MESEGLLLEENSNTCTRTVRIEHGYTHSVSIPKMWLQRLGWLMAKELKLEIEKHPTNPLLDNIKIKLLDPEESKR